MPWPTEGLSLGFLLLSAPTRRMRVIWNARVKTFVS